MSLGNKILELRKKKGITQEQLGEKINVTRQTISNWELEETTPNPKQLKSLSRALNISIDELLDNNIDNVVVEKVSNTEKLAGIIIKILKIIGIVLIVLVVIDIISFILYASIRKHSNVGSNATIICNINDTEYEIDFNTNKYFKCNNCSSKMTSEIKELVDFNNIDNTIDKVENYFESNNGTCE